VSDDELLAALGRSLEPPPSQPSEAELATFRNALAARQGGVVMQHAGRAGRGGWHRGSVAAAAAAIVLVAGGSAVAVGRNSLPGPVKVMAAAVGIDVDHHAIDGAHASETALRNALAGGDKAAVESAASELRARIAKLDAADQKALATEADALLARADALTGHVTTPTDEHSAGPGSTGTGREAPAGSTIPGASGSSHSPDEPPSATTPTTEPDDHAATELPGSPTTTEPDEQHRGSTSTSELDDHSGKSKTGPPPIAGEH